ncbi:tRNA 2-selenouridine(34) synthase MnmH [bacterium]|nr:tRNA 2-selenouridine(34) synthase MnmH [bacterium]
MAITLTSLTDLATLGFDAIIDVRAPAEYVEDHLPGAISLPVLDDAERARVGTIYKQVSPFTARKLGAALVSRNAARHLEGPLAEMPGGWRPLVYCWRGGQRSGSFATILGQIGWRVDTIAGGYKAWRSLVVKALYDTPVASPVVVVDGNTGTAKTALLARLAARGVQVIDLEGLARHRGSLFGHMAEGQPSQKAFEGALAMALAGLDPARPVVVEAESAKVGDLRLPPHLWAAMGKAPRLIIEAPLEERARYLTRAYADIVADRARLTGVIGLLRHAHAHETIEAWTALAEAGRFEALAHDLMERHYDPRYEKHRARSAAPGLTLALTSLEEAALDEVAGDLASAIWRLAGQDGQIAHPTEVRP